MGLVCPDVEIGIQDRLRTDCESVWVRLPLRALTCHFKKFSSRCRYGKQLATVNGSNSAGNKAIEIPQSESVEIGCSASLWGRNSVGRVPPLQGGSRGFESLRLHLILSP